MGLKNLLTSFLSLSQQSIVQPAPIQETFTLEVWLENSPLNHQAVSWHSSSDDAGYFGIEVRSPSEPVPSPDRTIFVRDSLYPESLFFQAPTTSSESEKGKTYAVFVQPTGEIQCASEVPGTGEPIEEQPFTGNFRTIDFTYWADKKTYQALEFEPLGFVWGVFLACPDIVGGKKGICFML